MLLTASIPAACVCFCRDQKYSYERSGIHSIHNQGYFLKLFECEKMLFEISRTSCGKKGILSSILQGVHQQKRLATTLELPIQKGKFLLQTRKYNSTKCVRPRRANKSTDKQNELNRNNETSDSPLPMNTMRLHESFNTLVVTYSVQLATAFCSLCFKCFTFFSAFNSLTIVLCWLLFLLAVFNCCKSCNQKGEHVRTQFSLLRSRITSVHLLLLSSLRNCKMELLPLNTYLDRMERWAPLENT